MDINEMIDLKDKQSIRSAFKKTMTVSTDRDVLETRKKELLLRANNSKQMGWLLIIIGVPLILAAGFGILCIIVGVFMLKSAKKQKLNVEETWVEMNLDSVPA